MDRIINVKVGGNHLSKDNKNAGVKGEANVTYLRITFDEGWDGYAKTVTFFDALGGNPVKRIETVDLIEDITTDARTYLTPIPQEPLAIAGEMTFVIDGYLDGKRQRSIADKLVVKDAPIADNATEPTDPTPEPYEQLQGQIDGIIGNIQAAQIGAETARDEAAQRAEDAQEFANAAANYSNIANAAATSAIISRGAAQNSAEQAEAYRDQAHNALGKTNYIGENGNWYAWDSEINAFYDTGIKAQSGSTVYLGDNPPDNADVWINPDGESTALSGKEDKSNKTTTVDYNSTDEQYPSARATFFKIMEVQEGLSNGINSVSMITGSVVNSVNELDEKKADITYVDDLVAEKADKTDVDERFSMAMNNIAYLDESGEKNTNKSKTIFDDPYHHLYPSTKAVYDFVSGKADETYVDERVDFALTRIIALEEAGRNFEFVQAVTLEEKVAVIQHTFDNQYKELHMRFKIPMSDEAAADAASTTKARWMAFTADENGALNQPIYNMGNQFVSDYKYTWYTAIHIKMNGKYCRTDLWYGNAQMMNDAYAMTDNSGSYSGFVAPSVPISRDYIQKLKISFMHAAGKTDASIRYLPVGTTYEIWGIRK